jgi:hypothetical protein
VAERRVVVPHFYIPYTFSAFGSGSQNLLAQGVGGAHPGVRWTYRMEPAHAYQIFSDDKSYEDDLSISVSQNFWPHRSPPTQPLRPPCKYFHILVLIIVNNVDLLLDSLCCCYCSALSTLGSELHPPVIITHVHQCHRSCCYALNRPYVVLRLQLSSASVVTRRPTTS